MKKSSTLLRYPGGKSRAIKTLDNYIPEKISSITSPFFGGGSFEIHLTNKGINVDGSDLFHQLVFFWDQVLNNPDQIADDVTPYIGRVTKSDLVEMQQFLRCLIPTSSKEQKRKGAAFFYIVNRCSFSGSTLSGGFSDAAISKRFTLSGVEKIRTFENPHLTVRHGDFVDSVINSTADMLFLDPPYNLGKGDILYGVNGQMHRGFDHTLLRDIVVDSKKKFLLTYNNDPEIKKLWEEHGTIKEVSWSYGMNKTKKSSEIVIFNYED